MGRINMHIFKGGFFSSLFLIVILFSCNSQEKKTIVTFNDLDLNCIKNIRLNIPDSIKNEHCYIKNIKNHNDYYYLMFNNRDNHYCNQIYIYNKRGELFKHIELKKVNEITTIEILNDNNILIIYYSSLENNYCYCIYDLEKKIFTKERIIYSVNSSVYPIFNDIKCISNNKIIFTFVNGQLYKGKSYKKFPILGYYDLEKDSLHFIKIWYPLLSDSIHYSKDCYYSNYNFFNNNECVITFNYTNVAYKWNVKTNSVQNICFKHSPFIPEIKLIDGKDSLNMNSNNKFYIYEDTYSLSDENGKIYIARYIKLPESSYGKKFGIMEIYDIDLNFLGARIVNVEKNIIKHLLLKVGFNENLGINSETFEVFTTKLIFKNITSKQLKDSLEVIKKVYQNEINSVISCCKIKNEKVSLNTDKIVKYLNLFIKDSACNVVIINFNGCHSCVDNIIDFYSKNQLFINFLKPKLYLLIFYDYEGDLKIIKDYMYKKNIKATSTVIYLQSDAFKAIQNKYNISNSFISLKNNETLKYIQYNSTEIINLWTDVLSVYGYKLEVKE